MKTFMLAMILATTSAFAMGGKGREFKKELNLTEEQVEKFRELKGGRGEMKELKAKFKESKKAFREAVKNPATSNDELRSKFEAFMKLRDEVQRKKFDRMLEKRAILTPEQFQKFMTMKKEWRKAKKDKRKE